MDNIDFYRLEWVSDPEDRAILYGVETVDGKKGTLVRLTAFTPPAGRFY